MLVYVTTSALVLTVIILLPSTTTSYSTYINPLLIASSLVPHTLRLCLTEFGACVSENFIPVVISFILVQPEA